MQWLSSCGLISVLGLCLAALHSGDLFPGSHSERNPEIADVFIPRHVRLLAFGDVNLGRTVGQEILAGDTLFPFARVRDTLAEYELVFANLESQLSNQHGETQHPRNNLIFSGPPAGAFSLRRGGVTVVATANNHALDYGVRALRETIQNLDAAGIRHAGTSNGSSGLYDPITLTRGGIRFAFLACTDIMNIEDTMWEKHVAKADTARLLPKIRTIRDSVDFVVVSYHGGDEYGEEPTARMKQFARHIIAGGADLVLGHHPHVPYGIEEIQGKYIVYSLGNFVFRQQERFWTQYSFAFAADIIQEQNAARISSFRCIPIHAGLQPDFVHNEKEVRLILERIGTLSSQSTTSLAAR